MGRNKIQGEEKRVRAQLQKEENEDQAFRNKTAPIRKNLRRQEAMVMRRDENEAAAEDIRARRAEAGERAEAREAETRAEEDAAAADDEARRADARHVIRKRADKEEL